MKDFKYPKLNDQGGYLEKRWFVYYFYKHPETGKLVRFRKYVSNSTNTITARRKEANALRDHLSEKSMSGFSPFQSEMPEELNLSKAIDMVVEHKFNTLKRKSAHSYTVMGRKFKKYLKEHQLTSIKYYQFNHLHAHKFSDYLLSENTISNRTYNNNINLMRIMFNFCKVIQSGSIKNNGLIELENAENGFYFITVTFDEKTITRKIIINGND